MSTTTAATSTTVSSTTTTTTSSQRVYSTPTHTSHYTNSHSLHTVVTHGSTTVTPPQFQSLNDSVGNETFARGRLTPTVATIPYPTIRHVVNCTSSRHHRIRHGGHRDCLHRSQYQSLSSTNPIPTHGLTSYHSSRNKTNPTPRTTTDPSDVDKFSGSGNEDKDSASPGDRSNSVAKFPDDATVLPEDHAQPTRLTTDSIEEKSEEDNILSKKLDLNQVTTDTY